MKIYLNNMVFYGFHGIYPEERKLGQKFHVNLVIYTDDKFDPQIKNLKDTVDYTEVFYQIKQIMEVQQFQLLEDCANSIITSILKGFKVVIGLKVIIEKPGVPMNASLSSVAIEMERFRRRKKYYLGLGTNIGDLEQNLRTAIDMIGRNNNCEIKQISSFHSTKPWGYIDQDSFLNAVLEVFSEEEPEDFLLTLQAIEIEMGKIKLFENGPRIIDVDILFCEDQVIDSDSLKIPHPRIAVRDFVLMPLLEIAPDFIHPKLNLTISAIYDKFWKEN